MKSFLKATTALGALLVLCVPLIVSDTMLFPYITGKNFTFRILVECTAAVWLLVCMYDVSFRPRASLILWSFVSFLTVLAVADAGGVDTIKSFWSNFERMEGFVTIAHFFLYFLILASLFREDTVEVLGEKVSFLSLFLWTSAVVAVIVSGTALQQIWSGLDGGSGWRVTGTTGNAAYMALYMLFSVFVAVTLAIRTNVRWMQITLALLALGFAFMLFQTATRGVVIGLGVSGIVTALYLTLFLKEAKTVRKLAAGVGVALLVCIGGLWFFHDSPAVQDNRMLQRATNINLNELTVRMTVWHVALQGVAERPLLGWGQGNFPVVFAKYYEPSLANQEPWFDRAHNVFLDWLVAGGVLALITYLALFASAAWYVLGEPLLRKVARFSVVEQALLFGIAAGYFVQNLVVFDTLISYVYFAALLAYIHARVGSEWRLTKLPVMTTEKVSTVALPVVAVSTIFIVYLVNVPLMRAASEIIIGLKADNIPAQRAAFSEAFYASKMGQPEVLRMAAERVRPILASEVATSTKQQLFETVDTIVTVYEQNNDLSAQDYTVLQSFYSPIDPARARAYAASARALGERKVDLIVNQGVTAYIAGDKDAAKRYWTEAYELYPEGREAQKFYAVVLLLDNRSEEIVGVVSPAVARQLTTDSFVESVAYQEDQREFLKQLYMQRIEAGEMTERTYVNLAMLYYNEGQLQAATETLTAAIELFPELRQPLSCAIANIETNKDINAACES